MANENTTLLTLLMQLETDQVIISIFTTPYTGRVTYHCELRKDDKGVQIAVTKTGPTVAEAVYASYEAFYKTAKGGVSPAFFGPAIEHQPAPTTDDDIPF